MSSQNSNFKIIYSLRVHLELQKKGFKCLTQMPNPQNNSLNCWVYENSAELTTVFNEIVNGGGTHGK